MPALASCNASAFQSEAAIKSLSSCYFRRYCLPASHHIHPPFLSNAEVIWDSVSGLRRFSVVIGNCSPPSCDGLGDKSSWIRHRRTIPIPVCSSTNCVIFPQTDHFVSDTSRRLGNAVLIPCKGRAATSRVWRPTSGAGSRTPLETHGEVLWQEPSQVCSLERKPHANLKRARYTL